MCANERMGQRTNVHIVLYLLATCQTCIVRIVMLSLTQIVFSCVFLRRIWLSFTWKPKIRCRQSYTTFQYNIYFSSSAYFLVSFVRSLLYCFFFFFSFSSVLVFRFFLKIHPIILMVSFISLWIFCRYALIDASECYTDGGGRGNYCQVLKCIENNA